MQQKIVIVGGGFAGINLAHYLNNELFDITLVDKNNFHAFAPLFYQIASSGLEPAAICFPFRQKLFRKKIRFYWGNLISIDASNNRIETSNGQLSYDFLILATGCKNNFYGNPELENQTYTLKSTSEAIALRNRILHNLELAAVSQPITEAASLLTFVVIGGGPTGIEIAGALGEMKKYILKREYREIPYQEVQVILVEGSDRILHSMSREASEKATLFLKQLDVEVILNNQLSQYDGKTACFKNGWKIETQTLIWTAGIIGKPVSGIASSVYSRQQRLLVDGQNRISGYSNIYAIGDGCEMVSEVYPNGHPQIAPVAIQQAKLLAKNLNSGFKSGSFVYRDKGSMATVGRNRAVVEVGKWHLYGRMAWFMWLFVHILTLAGFKNKIITFINWIWNYFTYNSSLRLLIEPDCNDKNHPETST